MSHSALLEYIRKAKDCGASDVDISERLHKSGWYNVDVKDALELYKKISSVHSGMCESAPKTPKPSLAERIVPHSYDPHLIAVAAVSFVLGFLLFLWLTHY
jgi:hypothetical protein